MKGCCENAIQVMQNWFKSNQGTAFPTFFYQVDNVTTPMYTDKSKLSQSKQVPKYKKQICQICYTVQERKETKRQLYRTS